MCFLPSELHYHNGVISVGLSRSLRRDNYIWFRLGSPLADDRKLSGLEPCSVKEISLDLRAEALEQAVALRRAVAL